MNVVSGVAKGRRLADYRGVASSKGEPDKMLRHIRRTNYIRERAAMLVGRLGLSGPPQISGFVVVRAPQPMEHIQAAGADTKVVMFDDLDQVPWAEGWAL